MKRSLLLILILLLPAALLRAADAHRFYVAPTGSDTNAGTSLSSPFSTVEKARQAVRALKREGQLDKPVEVLVRGGNYLVQKPLLFDFEDSGAEAFPITYTAYNGEEVVFNGGRTISGWKPYKNGIWMTRLPAVKQGQWKFRQLYVNGQQRQRARTPNKGFLRVKGLPEGGLEVGYHTDCQSFEYAEGDINPRWTNLDDVEVIVYHFWTDSHLPIQSIDPKTRIVTFKHKAGKVFTDDFTNGTARYIVENVWEGLDAPGEWYLNKKTGVLYYYPLPGEDLGKVEVVAPFAPEFIRLEGKPTERKPVSHLRFRGLSFQYTNWDLPPGDSNDKQGSAGVPACITLSGARHVVFENCQISNTGTFAFDLLNGSQHNQIRSCDLSYLGGGGIRMNGGTENDHPLLRTSHNTFADNLLHHYGEVFPSAVGVLLMHTSHNTVSHNTIHHGWYTGISVGWVWGYKRSTANHNLVADNHIHDIGQGLLSDMGGVYLLGPSPGTVVRNNLLHDINSHHYGGWGIYHDEGTSHVLVEKNIVYNTKFAPCNIHYSKEVTVRNNIFALGREEQVTRQRVEPHKSVFFENNIVYWKEGPLFNKDWKDKPYQMHLDFRGSREMTSTFDMDYNLYFNPNLTLEKLDLNGEKWAEWQERGKDKHSLYADPMFVDVEKYDFRLKPESPAFRLGFEAIDMTNVGAGRKPKIEKVMQE
jgi:hypothetical protein